MRYAAPLLLAYLIALAGCGGGENASATAETRTASTLQHGFASMVLLDDEIILPNDRAQYQIISNDAGYTVAAIPDDGNKQIYSTLRRIQFADTSLALDLEHSSRIFRLYQAAFNRTPDLAGLGFWLNALDNDVSLDHIAAAFIGSEEFQKLYGVDPDDQLFLTNLYRNVFHRAPDADGFKFWLEALRTGTSRISVLVQFSESDENKKATTPTILNGIAFAQPGVAYRPVAKAGNDRQIEVGVKATLDGSESSDANGDMLKFSWSLTARPTGSSAIVLGETTARPSFVPDIAGKYVLTLTVYDALLSSRTASITVLATGIVAAPPAPIPDSGIYKCALLTSSMAKLLYDSGHTYLDRDHDGKPCEANDIAVESYVAPTPSPPPTIKQCWVNGYTRKNGTYVKGYWRRC